MAFGGNVFLDAGYWILYAGCWILDTVYGLLVIGYSMTL
jgi:hypothetical protein